MQKPASPSRTKCIVLGIVIGCFVMAVLIGVVGLSYIESELPEESSSGIVTRIMDGETLFIDDIRYDFAMVSTPLNDDPGFAAKQSVIQMCPIGSTALVEVTERKPVFFAPTYFIGIVHCETDRYTDSVSSRLVRAGHVDQIFLSQCDGLEAATHEWAVENDEYFYHYACGGK